MRSNENIDTKKSKYNDLKIMLLGRAKNNFLIIKTHIKLSIIKKKNSSPFRPYLFIGYLLIIILLIMILNAIKRNIERRNIYYCKINLHFFFFFWLCPNHVLQFTDEKAVRLNLERQRFSK